MLLLIFLYFSRSDYGFYFVYIGEMLTFFVSGLEMDKRFAFTLLFIRNYSKDDAFPLANNMDSDCLRG